MAMYSGRWAFTSDDNTNPKTYPPGNELLIGEYEPGKYLMAWADEKGLPHVLCGLSLQENSSFLSASQCTVVDTKGVVNVTVSTALGKGDLRAIAASVKGLGIGEGNLTGNWGAEGPPPRPPIGLIARILRWLRKVLVTTKVRG